MTVSTDPSTNPSDVSRDVVRGGRAAGQPEDTATTPAHPGQQPGAGRNRNRRGRRRRGGRKGEARTPERQPPDSPQRAGLPTMPTTAPPSDSAPPSPTRPPAGPAGATSAGTTPDAAQRPDSVPTPNDLARGRRRGATPVPDPDRVAASVDRLPVDPDRPRPRVTPPKPSDLVSVTATITKTGLTAAAKPSGKKRRRPPRPERPNGERLRTVRETSAGGLVISDLDLPVDELSAALIGRVDRRGRMMWSLPKGHIETGETAEQTAIREVAEETGIHGTVVAPLGKIDYWFVSEGRRIHKTVHHYLLRSVGGELSDADYEVSEVAWVPLHELPRRLTYSDERRLARMARGVIADLAADPHRLAKSEADSIRTEPNAYEKAAAARNQRRNETPPPVRSRRRRRRSRRPSAGDG